ncbi:hypothetical protein HZB07_01875 [Candidatus Saganbacteria bacterium]|nr:hypothetical protein [Candidatus Saganbacteria bacterium]
MGLEQVNQQQGAVLGNLSAAQSLDQILKSEFERKLDTNNNAKVAESVLKKALNGQADKAGVQILANLANKLAQQIGQAKLLNNLAKDYGFALDGRQENTNDIVDVNNPITAVSSSKQKKQFSGQTGTDLGQDDDSAQSDVKEYLAAYSQTLVCGGQEAKRKMEQLEKKLLAEHEMNYKDVKNLKLQAANSIRGEVALQVKDAYLNLILAKSKSMEWLIAKSETQDLLFFAEKKMNLGGHRFGNYKGGLQGVVNEAKEDIHGLLRDFVDDALTGEVIKKVTSDDPAKTEKAIDELLKLGTKVGYDVQQFMEKLPKLTDNLGLNLLIYTEYIDTGTGTSSDQKQRHQYQYTVQEEKDILTDKLRALYMRRAVYGDARTLLETQFKMIRSKNGLIKLGVSNFDRIEKEATACAKIKLFEMLREGFEERATYAKLEGAAWQMTERKLKTVLRNLDKIGVSLSQIELDQIRDKANEKMFREAEHEFSLLNTAIEAQGEMAFLTNKRKLINGMLERVAAESGFQTPGHELELSIKEAC